MITAWQFTDSFPSVVKEGPSETKILILYLYFESAAALGGWNTEQKSSLQKMQTICFWASEAWKKIRSLRPGM